MIEAEIESDITRRVPGGGAPLFVLSNLSKLTRDSGEDNAGHQREEGKFVVSMQGRVLYNCLVIIARFANITAHNAASSGRFNSRVRNSSEIM